MWSQDRDCGDLEEEGNGIVTTRDVGIEGPRFRPVNVQTAI